MDDTKELIKQKINELNKTNQTYLNLNSANKVNNNMNVYSSSCSSICSNGSSSSSGSNYSSICSNGSSSGSNYNNQNNNNDAKYPYNGYLPTQNYQQQQQQFQAMSYQQNMLPNPGHVLHQQFPVHQQQYQMPIQNPMQYSMKYGNLLIIEITPHLS